VIEQRDLEARLAAVLEPEGFPHSAIGSAQEGWKVFLFNGLGEAAIMWSRPDDHENAEAGVVRDLNDQHLRMSYLERILAVLSPLGYGAELAFPGGTPRITLTSVPA
jgi:hypothetical protein